ncbi:MAG: helix-turn-helix domain-containing protein [Elusimicrobiota bacterium]|jgi:transcriptional regulator with XRE-family HTH domain|nr:helix-turn-helix domain-containing protein [Elusimicrobiota bacterium]
MERNEMFNKIYMETAKRIKAALLDTKMTQLQLAKKLGISHPVVSTFVSGKRKTSEKTLQKIAAATGKPLSYFLSGDSDAAIGDITGDNNIGHNNKGAVNYNNLLSYRDLLVKRLEGIEKNSESTKLNFNNLETQHKLLEAKLDLILEKLKK